MIALWKTPDEIDRWKLQNIDQIYESDNKTAKIEKWGIGTPKTPYGTVRKNIISKNIYSMTKMRIFLTVRADICLENIIYLYFDTWIHITELTRCIKYC